MQFKIYDNVFIRIVKPLKSTTIFIVICLLIAASAIFAINRASDKMHSDIQELRMEILKEQKKSEYYKIDESVNSLAFITRVAMHELGYVDGDAIFYTVVTQEEYDRLMEQNESTDGLD